MEQEHIANTNASELSLGPDPFLQVSCPFLGVRDDPGTPMGYPTPGNQCYAFESPLHVDLEKQREHCLSDCYTDCLYFQQQMAETPAENGGRFRASAPLRRIVNGRSLAVMLMLLLILLAVLIWWPPPGTSIDEGTVFGVSFSLNSPNVEREREETVDQQVVAQENTKAEESVAAVNVDGHLDEAEQPESLATAGEKAGGQKRSHASEQSAGQGASLNLPSIDEAPSVDGFDNVLEEPGLSPAVQDSSPKPEPGEVVEEEPSAVPGTTAVEDTPVIEERVEENAPGEPAATVGKPVAEGGAVPQIVDSAEPDLPNDEQGEQSPAADSADGTRKKSEFNPIAYEEKGSDEEILNVFLDPDVESGNYIRIARPELFSLLGRDKSAEWIKIRTTSGIEGWVLVSETELGSWIESLPEIEPE